MADVSGFILSNIRFFSGPISDFILLFQSRIPDNMFILRQIDSLPKLARTIKKRRNTIKLHTNSFHSILFRYQIFLTYRNDFSETLFLDLNVTRRYIARYIFSFLHTQYKIRIIYIYIYVLLLIYCCSEFLITFV